MRLRLTISTTAKLRIASLLIFLILGSLVSETFAVSLGNNDLEGLSFVNEDNKSEGESANNVNNRGCKKVESGYEDSEIEINPYNFNKKIGFLQNHYSLKVYSPLDLGDCYCLPLKFRKSRLEEYDLIFLTDFHILYHCLVFYEHLS